MELGLGAHPDEAATELIAHIYDTLETRVGTMLAETMGPETVDQFAGINETDSAAREAFLAAHVPDHKDVGEREFARLTKMSRQWSRKCSHSRVSEKIRFPMAACETRRPDAARAIKCTERALPMKMTHSDASVAEWVFKDEWQ